MPNTAEIYRLNAINEYRTQLNAKLAQQHIQREGEVPIHGNEEQFNLGDIMLSNIMESRYFFKVLDILDFEEVLEEIKREVHDLEPLVIGSSRHPSSAFCILYKLSRMHITYQELNQMIHSSDSPYIRGIGFLYIRFAIPPRELWKYLAPYFDDDTRIVPFANKVAMTLGSFVLSLIENKRYQELILPMIPIVVKREWDVNILKLKALDNREVLPGPIEEGDSVMGFYGVDLMWYPAKVLKVYNQNAIYIMYDTYNNKEIRTRGHILINGEDPTSIKFKSEEESNKDSYNKHSRSSSRSRSRHSHHSHHSSHHSSHHHRSRSRSSSRHTHHSSRHSHSRSPYRHTSDGLFDEQHLAEIAREKERRAAEGNGHACGVNHVKRSMIMKMDRFTAEKEEYIPEKEVVVREIKVEDSLQRLKEENERKERERAYKRRLESVQKMYSRDKGDDNYNRDYY